MSNYKELMEKKEYLSLLEEAKGKKDPESLFYSASAYLALNDGKKALDILLSNRDILWADNPVLTMKSTFEIRFALKEFDEAYEDMKDFENRPYVSQEVEEVLRGLNGYIRANERATFHYEKMEPEELKEKLLTTKDDFMLLQLLSKVEADPSKYLSEIRSIVSSDRNDSLRTFALLLLVQAKDEKEITFVKREKEYKLIPSALEAPFVNETYKKTLSLIEGGSKNTSIIQAAKSLYDNEVLAIYPETGEEDLKLNAAAYLLLAAKYLGAAAELLISGIDEEKAKKLSESIENDLEKSESVAF